MFREAANKIRKGAEACFFSYFADRFIRVDKQPLRLLNTVARDVLKGSTPKCFFHTNRNIIGVEMQLLCHFLITKRVLIAAPEEQSGCFGNLQIRTIHRRLILILKQLEEDVENLLLGPPRLGRGLLLQFQQLAYFLFNGMRDKQTLLLWKLEREILDRSKGLPLL